MAKPKPKPDDKEQSKRFIEKAKEVSGDDAGEAFERAVKRVVRKSPPPSRAKRD